MTDTMTGLNIAPTPWRVGERDGEDLLIVDATGSLVALADCDWLANNADKVDAQAALLASAPELLAALEYLVAAQAQPFDHADRRASIVQARAAIAKATQPRIAA